MSDVVQRLEDMAVGRSQHATDRNDARSAADDIRAVIARLEAQAEPIVAPAECDASCDDPECPYSHKPLTLRQAYENAVTRLRSAEAALRAAVPEEGPVGVRCTGCGSSWDDDRLAEEKAKRPELLSCCPERKIVPVYLRPTPRPDMERDLAEAIEQRDYFKAEAEAGTEYIAAQREKIDILGRELAEARAAHAEAVTMAATAHRDAVAAQAERDALAADKARLEAALHAIADEDEPHTRLNQERLCCKFQHIARAALSGASIPAPADDRWKAQAQQATSVIAMIRAMIQEMFGPIANMESGEATLLRGPETKHDGEAILEALQRIASALAPAPDKAGRKMEPVSIDYLRGQIGEILVLELDAKEDGRAVSQAVERILALVAASSAPDKAEARREATDE